MFVLALAGLGKLFWSESSSPAAAADIGVRVPILTYHGIDYSGSMYSITPEQLDEQCRWLVENGYTSITVWQFWDAVAGSGQLPPLPVVLTADDGLTSALTFAEVLGRHGMSGTYFINSGSYLTTDQIASLALQGGVQAHTVNHANLAGMSYDAQFQEIAQNMADIERLTGQPVRFLAWPFGASDSSASEAAAAAGIVAAFGLGGTAANTGAVDPFYIPRIMITNEDDLATFAAKVTSW
jgi:peptidoglycan/xylan/chitin deacetylase (PgdA/CDA1 family)